MPPQLFTNFAFCFSQGIMAPNSEENPRITIHNKKSWASDPPEKVKIFFFISMPTDCMSLKYRKKVYTVATRKLNHRVSAKAHIPVYFFANGKNCLKPKKSNALNTHVLDNQVLWLPVLGNGFRRLPDKGHDPRILSLLGSTRNRLRFKRAFTSDNFNFAADLLSKFPWWDIILFAEWFPGSVFPLERIIFVELTHSKRIETNYAFFC